MELSYKGVKDGDFVKVSDETVNPNCDGWGRDLPRNPWDDTSYTAMIMYGKVMLVTDLNGSRSELHFYKPKGWHRPISTFLYIEKITQEEMLKGRDSQEGYEKDKDGKRVPCGTAKREYCGRNS